jgi:hypothetical protein
MGAVAAPRGVTVQRAIFWRAIQDLRVQTAISVLSRGDRFPELMNRVPKDGALNSDPLFGAEKWRRFSSYSGGDGFRTAFRMGWEACPTAGKKERS